MRIGQEGARQRQALTLPAGKRDAAFTDDGRVPLVKGLDELVRLGRGRCRLDHVINLLGMPGKLALELFC